MTTRITINNSDILFTGEIQSVTVPGSHAENNLFDIVFVNFAHGGYYLSFTTVGHNFYNGYVYINRYGNIGHIHTIYAVLVEDTTVALNMLSFRLSDTAGYRTTFNDFSIRKA